MGKACVSDVSLQGRESKAVFPVMGYFRDHILFLPMLSTCGNRIQTVTSEGWWTLIRVVCLVGSLALLVGCGGKDDSALQVRIYDPRKRSDIEVTTDDFMRESARAAQVSPDFAAIFVQLTDRGANRFEALTRALAEQGARMKKPQMFFVAIDEKVYARVAVDYRAFPDGLDAEQGIQIEGMDLATAIELASRFRGEK